jgi:hypothetical protein
VYYAGKHLLFVTASDSIAYGHNQCIIRQATSLVHKLLSRPKRHDIPESSHVNV